MASQIKKKYWRLNEVDAGVDKLYHEGITKGLYVGFEGLNELFSFKDSSTTYIYSNPFAGKTEWWFEILVNLSEFYGYKHVIYSPESGDKHAVFAELVSKFLRKPFYKNINGHISEQELYHGRAFINEHFFVIDPEDSDLSIEDFYKLVDEIENEYEVKINTTSCDPFNELKHEFNGERQDLYIENRLGFIRKNAMKHKRHNCIITHCSDQGHPIMKDGVQFYPPPTPRQIAGGQAWFRKAMNLICVWRPPFGLNDENGNPYADNEAQIIIQKFKPKGVGKRGIAKLYYDNHTNRYYELFNGERRYASLKRPITIREVSIPDYLL